MATLNQDGTIPARFTDEEKIIIGTAGDSVMRVLTVDNEEEDALLRGRSAELSPEEMNSETFNILISRMLATVNDPDNPGVGIAAPQVGISRRIALVQRMDKEGEPFEAYVNLRIVGYGEDIMVGGEGCLSVPGRSGRVARAEKIRIAYTDPETLGTTEEEIEGFTAVIFQHETDHLEGIIYTDRMEECEIRTITYQPHGVCTKEISIVTENDIISAVQFTGGCRGNTQGVGALLEGMHVEEAIGKLEGIICGDKGTSCPDQLSKALKLMKEQKRQEPR